MYSTRVSRLAGIGSVFSFDFVYSVVSIVADWEPRNTRNAAEDTERIYDVALVPTPL